MKKEAKNTKNEKLKSTGKSVMNTIWAIGTSAWSGLALSGKALTPISSFILRFDLSIEV